MLPFFSQYPPPPVRQVLAFYGEPQYSTVGDTFVVGCRVGRSVVYADTTFHDNPDVTDPRYRWAGVRKG